MPIILIATIEKALLKSIEVVVIKTRIWLMFMLQNMN